MTDACFALHTVGINVDTRDWDVLTSTVRASEKSRIVEARIFIRPDLSKLARPVILLQVRG
jgi:hypothetical protein